MLEKKELFPVQCETLLYNYIWKHERRWRPSKNTCRVSNVKICLGEKKKGGKMKGCGGRERMELTDIVVFSFSHCEIVMSSRVIALAEERWTDTKWEKRHETQDRFGLRVDDSSLLSR